MAETEERHWWFSGRRAVLASLIARLALPRDSRILEIGCGTGGNLAMLSAFGRVSALESDATARAIAVEKTAGRFEIRAGSCPDDIPYPGASFELVCLIDVLEHIDETLPSDCCARNRSATKSCTSRMCVRTRFLISGSSPASITPCNQRFGITALFQAGETFPGSGAVDSWLTTCSSTARAPSQAASRQANQISRFEGKCR